MGGAWAAGLRASAGLPAKAHGSGADTVQGVGAFTKPPGVEPASRRNQRSNGHARRFLCIRASFVLKCPTNQLATVVDSVSA